MNRAIVIIVLACALLSCVNHKTNNSLKLIKAYSVVTNNVIEPSGLTLWNGDFYTVSDKEDWIYKLVFNQDQIKLLPFIKINNDKGGKLDFEGITHDEDFFYLVSEMYFQILKVSKDGSQQTWLPESNLLKISGQNAGLFKTNNANFEGICFLGNDEFLLAAERQPRGFIQFNVKSQDTKAYQVNQVVYEYQLDRSPDFTGLSCDNGLFVLDRNSYTVAKLIKKEGKYTEGKGYSFEHIVKQQNLQYQDMRYGHAEGLVVKGNSVYIILDNNRNPHVYGNNSNSLFIEMKK